MTQKKQVKNLFNWRQLNIKWIAKETWILEPNVRRILWEGTKEWIFTRVAKWVYKIVNENWATWIFKMCDSLKEIKKVSEKFDMIFLDIPYKTKAVTGGWRWVKYPLITEWQFSEFLGDLKNVLRSENTPVYYMYSNAPSWKTEMLQYNSHLEKQGFKRVDYWELTKIYKNWKLALNVRGVPQSNEGLALYSLSWKLDPWSRIMDFTCIRPRVASEKPKELVEQIIKQSSKAFNNLFEPFGWTGVFSKMALKLDRNIECWELSWKRFYNEILKIN